jgi:uncharacterized membrane protein YccC
MAATKDRVKYAAGTAKPYLERALTDEEFRQNLRDAFAAARAIYEELGGSRGLTTVATRVAGDEEIHANLRRAIGELRQAADRIQERERPRSHALRNIALLATGVAIGIFFNPFTGRTTRHWVKGKVTAGPGEPVAAGSPNGSSG